MKKFLIFVSVTAVLVLGAYKFYPTQTKLAQSTLAVAGKNLSTAIVLSVESLGNGSANKTTSATTQRKSGSDVVGSKTQEVSKPSQPVVYTGSSAAVAPANVTCFINTTTGQSERVTPAQWNAFVQQHPDYVRGVTSQNGAPVYVASAPNLLNSGTTAQQQNEYFVTLSGQSTNLQAVPYGTFEADVQAYQGQGWKVFRDGNSYALVAPNEKITFPDGKQFSNAQ